jgi:hypothetical protein
MDFLIVKYWLLTFIGITLFLGGLTYFILQQNFTDKFQLDQMNQQGHRTSASNRRKNARNANKRKQQQQQQQQTTTNNGEITEEEEQKRILPKITTQNDEKDFSGQQTDEEQEEKGKFQDINQTKQIIFPPTHVEDEQEATISIKQRNKTKTLNKPPPPSLPSSKEESIIPSKPQACVAPVKQTPLMKDSTNNLKSSQNHQDNYPKSNGHLSSSHNIYTYSAYNPLPPRFQQQRQQQKEAAYATQKYRRRRGGGHSKRSSFPPDSAARSNDFIPASLKQQDINENQTESLGNFTQQQELSINNGYSSESDILTGKILYFRIEIQSAD